MNKTIRDNNIIRTIRYKENLAQEISMLISELYFLLKHDYSEDLTHQSVRVLQYIEMFDGNPRIDDVKNYLGLAATSTSELVKRLASKGLVERTRSVSDERVVEVSLTEKGRVVLAEQTRMDKQKLAQCLVDSEDADDQHLVETLRKVLSRAQILANSRADE